MICSDYMKMALDLAKKGCGFVAPNPMVGAVIVKNNEVIGCGYHEKFGGLHAERNAINSCTQSMEGADLYVTLEPCCHYGKTPPCTDILIEKKFGKVVIGSKDPNPLVAGRSIAQLINNGVSVATGVLEEDCNHLNEVFFHYIQTQTPYVAMKYAMTLDGKIASCSGESMWITGEAARENVHRLRHQYSAIMVGVGTVIADNPMLNCRLDNCKNPVRIICDTNLRIPLSSRIADTAQAIPTYIACHKGDPEKVECLIKRGFRILEIEKKNERIDMNSLISMLYNEGIDSILLEGGSTVNYAALESGIVNKVYVYISPKIIGGKDAKTPVGGIGIERLENAFRMKYRRIDFLGEDIMLEYELEG